MDIEPSYVHQYLQWVQACVSLGSYELLLDPEKRPDNVELLT